MKRIDIKRNVFTLIPYLAFFTGLFIYFAFFVNYLFFVQEKASLFLLSSDFLLENLRQPGGLLIWLGKFFSAFYYYPLVGAIIVTTIITLTLFILAKIILFITGGKAKVLPFIIGTALFYLQTDYHFMLFNILGLFLQLAFFYLVIRYFAFLKGWVPVIFAPLWYYATGSFAFVFYLLFTCYLASDKDNKGWIKIIVLWSLYLVSFFLSKELIFSQPGTVLLTFPFSVPNTGSQQILFLSVLGLVSVSPLIYMIKPWFSEKFRNYLIRFNVVVTVALIIVLCVIGIRQFDKKAKQYFFIENLFYQNKFEEIIAFNTSNPTTNSLTSFLNNIALSEEDKLDDLLFHFPQSPDGKTLFLKWQIVSEILNRGGYFYYSIGLINEAQRWAFENMVMKGLSPEGLKLLIRTELINANYETAGKYINILKQSLFYRKDAIAYGKMLFNDEAVKADRELGKKRQTMVKSDFFTLTDNPSVNIEMILSSDSLNRKAFEYKVALMLLTKNFKVILQYLPQFEKLGFTRLPVHIEEAAIALAISNKGKLPDIGNLRISKSTELRWNQYRAVLQEYGNDVKAAEPEMRRRFGDTFWYYVFYR